MDKTCSAIKPWAPVAVHQLMTATWEADLSQTGFTGASSYSCKNYSSPIHKDKDRTWSIVNQLHLDLPPSGHPAKDFNFAYAQWGVYLITEENMVW